ncbi:MAG TPA: small ribosomal subunit Rsm22 family protein [Kofleriaceae bacterium]|nr:small ribosomal subunit Rsm22 family protein [Kofleriaceae bacterium]
MIVPPVPAVIEDELWAAARRRLPPEVCGGPALTHAVIDRSRRYTSEREQLAVPIAGRAAAADLAARALFFTIADVAKPWLPLGELADGLLPAPEGFLAGDELRLLDVGAGCGAMTLGVLAFLAARDRPPRVRATLIDRDAAALAIAEDAIGAVAGALGLDVDLDVRAADLDVLSRLPARAFELVVAGSVLNELEPVRARAAADAMLAAATPHGVVIVVEPALRTTSRALHALRDALLGDRAATVLAPCTRRAAPCPALADERDWCHDHRPLTLPPRANQLAQVTGLRDGELKVAYLALTPDLAVPASAAVRVVSDPRGEKGKHTLTACGPAGWVPLRLLRRHRAPANRAFERARRGDLLVVEPTPAAGEVTAETSVTPPVTSPGAPDPSGPGQA